MTYLFRMITANKWLKEPTNPIWGKKELVPADTIGDLRTTDNTLSVYELKSRLGSQRSKNEITKIAAALATTQQTPKHISYVLLDYDELKRLGFDIRSSPDGGDTADEEVNKRHHDIADLRAEDLIQLALHIEKIDNPPLRDRTLKEAIYKRLKLDIKKLNNKKIKITDNKIRKEIGLPERECKDVEDTSLPKKR